MLPQFIFFNWRGNFIQLLQNFFWTLIQAVRGRNCLVLLVPRRFMRGWWWLPKGTTYKIQTLCNYENHDLPVLIFVLILLPFATLLSTSRPTPTPLLLLFTFWPVFATWSFPTTILTRWSPTSVASFSAQRSVLILALVFTLVPTAVLWAGSFFVHIHVQRGTFRQALNHVDIIGFSAHSVVF